MKEKVFYAVVNEPNGTPLAIFQEKFWAEAWKHNYSRTSEIEEYTLGIV